MKFKKAFDLMKKGLKMKLPTWGGYWEWHPEEKTIYMHTKDGQIIDIRDSEDLSYTLSNILQNDWEVADPTNTTILGGAPYFKSKDAIRHLLKGAKIQPYLKPFPNDSEECYYYIPEDYLTMQDSLAHLVKVTPTEKIRITELNTTELFIGHFTFYTGTL